MDPVLRLHYLDAMGITQYVARTPLPGAKPTLPISIVQHSTVPVADNRDATSAIVNSTTSMAPASQVTASETAGSTRKTGSSNAIPAIINRERTSTSNAAPAGQPFHCQIAYWHVNDLLVLADIPRLDSAYLSLLNDILFAIRRDKLPQPDAFQWPIGNLADTSLLSARDYFQGLLDAGLLKKDGLRQILLFGSAPLQLFGHPDNGSHDYRYRDWPVIALPGLPHLLNQPDSKAEAWKKLLPLVLVV